MLCPVVPLDTRFSHSCCSGSAVLCHTILLLRRRESSECWWCSGWEWKRRLASRRRELKPTQLDIEKISLSEETLVPYNDQKP